MTRKLIAGALAPCLGALLMAATAAPALAELKAPPTPRAVIADTPRDPKTPATMDAFTIPTGGVGVNAVFYLASGDQPRPTMLFLHGFPGNETNIDLMQAARRAGWNVLKINYRGSWGSPGIFSFANARADAEAAVAFLEDPANVAKYRIDPARIVVAGHSMGGFMAASASAARPEVAGAILLDAWDIGHDPRFTPGADRRKLADDMRPDTVPLAGTSPEALIAEIDRDKAGLDLVALSRQIAKRPLLLVGADHGVGMMTKPLGEAARQVAPANVVEVHLPSDHGFSDARIALEGEVVRWLARFEPKSAATAPFPPLKGAYDPSNVFARIIRGELPSYKVYEDADVLAFMDRAPLEAGHVLVISKTSKARNLLEIDPKDLAKVMAVAQRVGQAQVDALGLEGFMILQNNGVGQSVPHLHVHVIPRIAGKPVYLAENAVADPKDLEAMAARIRAAMK